jgi:hypothetical protein
MCGLSTVTTSAVGSAGRVLLSRSVVFSALGARKSHFRSICNFTHYINDYNLTISMRLYTHTTASDDAVQDALKNATETKATFTVKETATFFVSSASPLLLSLAGGVRTYGGIVFGSFIPNYMFSVGGASALGTFICLLF